MFSTNELLSETLSLPSDAIAYEISRRLTASLADWSLIEGLDCDFDLWKYAREGLCELTEDPSLHNQVFVGYDRDKGAEYRPENAGYEVLWRGKPLKVLLATFRSGSCRETYYWIAAERKRTAQEFFEAVCGWNVEIRDEVLVFEGGGWTKSPELFDSIKTADFDSLILDESLKSELRGDLRRFLASKPLYEKFGIPWKRGVVLIGPPGNGKTHAVKALVNELKLPCLYVKSLIAEYSTDHDCIRSIFERARKSAPCILAFEDLDSLITDANRSFFLNELDGFADNAGIVAVASTNHPEKLDPAIVDRPSRFDRKYHFHLPTIELRRRYLEFWNRSFVEEERLTDESIDAVARRTEGFSFAYLKELVGSSLMRWIGGDGSAGLGDTMIETADLLRSQMSSAAPTPPEG